MVDFQSRDTRRGYTSNADDEDASAGDEDTSSSDDPAGAGDDAEIVATPDAAESAAAGDVPPESLGVGLVAVTRGESVDDDPAVEAVVGAFDAAALAVATRELIAPDFDRVQTAVSTVAKREDVDLVVTVGAVGAGPADVVPEAVRPLLDRELPGFGELLRLLAHDEIGSEILTLRPLAGILDATPVFCLPGEAWTARIGATEIVVPEAPRVVEVASAGAEDEETADER
jgi:molybdenum cofactor biosynthesis protein B